MQLYGLEPIKVSYSLARFDGHKHSGSEDKMILVYYEIL